MFGVCLVFWGRGGGDRVCNVRVLPLTRVIRRYSEKLVRIKIPTVQKERIDRE